jgi:hypothetical protein
VLGLPAGLTYRGTRLHVETTPERAAYSIGQGDEPLLISHWGGSLEVAPGATVKRPIPAAEPVPEPSQPAHRAADRTSKRSAVDPDG